ncbi:MAG: HamA C-terminal domain-containing protein, partial [bacterium]
CHSVKVDQAGRPRVSDLADAICESALDFAIPRSEIEQARARDAQTGSTRQMTRLHNLARGLFTDLTNSGEGGELLLFVLAETVLRLPQVMCKMSLKTNTRMHVHGVDGVHAGVDPDTGQFALYWGESKIYQDASTAIRDCLASLAPVLIGTGPDGAAARDLQLLQRAADLNEAALERALKAFLDPRNAAYNELEFRGLCLVGFNSDAYPTEAAQHDEIVAAIVAQLPAWKAQIQRRVTAEQLERFALHVFCVPFPNVDHFRAFMRCFLGIADVAA